MAIPDFNSSGVLPPHLGNPVHASKLSPYPATASEVCKKYGNPIDRREILHGWLQLRALLRSYWNTSGFQWLDGSFMEDTESRRGGPPKDIDVISFLPTAS